MGLLDRVNQANLQQRQGGSAAGATVAAPPVAPSGNGPTIAPPPPAPPPKAPEPPKAGEPPKAPGGLTERAATSGGAIGVTPQFAAAKTAVHAKLLEQYANKIDVTDREFVREKIVELTDEYVRSSGLTLTRPDKERLIESLMDDILGLGPLEVLLNDREITEIMINHPKQIYIERKGVPMLSEVTF